MQMRCSREDMPKKQWGQSDLERSILLVVTMVSYCFSKLNYFLIKVYFDGEGRNELDLFIYFLRDTERYNLPQANSSH